MSGKLLRMAKLCQNPLGKMCIVAMDHGVTNGPIDGIEDYVNTIRAINQAKPNAIILHKGLLKQISHYSEMAMGNYIMHLSVSTMLSDDPNYKILAGTVEEAIKLGAIGVSIHINLGVRTETSMLKDFGMVSRMCDEWGMPLLAMVYSHGSEKKIENMIHAARIAEELGADMVKVAYPGSSGEVKNIMDKIHIPVIIAGGEVHKNFGGFLGIIEESIESGAAGVAVGRNIFQNEDPYLATSQIIDILNNVRSRG